MVLASYDGRFNRFAMLQSDIFPRRRKRRNVGSTPATKSPSKRIQQSQFTDIPTQITVSFYGYLKMQKMGLLYNATFFSRVWRLFFNTLCKFSPSRQPEITVMARWGKVERLMPLMLPQDCHYKSTWCGNLSDANSSFKVPWTPQISFSRFMVKVTRDDGQKKEGIELPQNI